MQLIFQKNFLMKSMMAYITQSKKLRPMKRMRHHQKKKKLTKMNKSIRKLYKMILIQVVV
jgi:hypothetical protein